MTARFVRISDPTDERLADYAALTDATLRKRYENQHGVLIAEGPNPVRALLSSPYPVRSVLVDEAKLEPFGDLLNAVDAPVFVVSRELLYEVVRFKLHQGIIACGARLAIGRASDGLHALIRSSSRLVVLEFANDHENLGVIFRSARALGADGVLLGPGCADPLYRRTVRVSMGHVLHLPFAWLPDLPAGLRGLADAGFTRLALTPSADAVDIGDLELSRGARTAVLLGAEGPGLSEASLAAADVLVRIPIHQQVDSLNVATAGAIAFHALGWANSPEGEPDHGVH